MLYLTPWKDWPAITGSIQGQIPANNFTQWQAALERVIKKVFCHYKIPYEPSDQVRTIFKSKLWRMGQSLAKLGGSRRKQLIDQWKGTCWALSFDSNLTKKLFTRKRHLEEQVESEKAKRLK